MAARAPICKTDGSYLDSQGICHECQEKKCLACGCRYEVNPDNSCTACGWKPCVHDRVVNDGDPDDVHLYCLDCKRYISSYKG